MDSLGIVKEIFTIALAIKTAVETAQQNKAVCGQIGARVQVLTDIIRWLEEMEATKKPAMQASLKDLKEILDEALAQVKKCREKHIVSRLIKADSLSKDLQKVNQDIMDQMQIAHFAIAVNNSKQTALIVSRITSGVQLTLAKDAGQWEDSAHTEHSLLLGVPIPKRIKRFTIEQLRFATWDFSSDKLIAIKKDTSLIYKGNLNGKDVVIKRYTTPSAQSARQYIPDFQRLHQHESIVEILGYCIDTSVETMSDRATCRSAQMSDSILVVEEYMPNGSLDDILRLGTRKLGELNWSTCSQIIRGIARGLEYIHANRFIHLYMTFTNILLDANMNPKISGFAICQQMDHESEGSTQAVIEKLLSLKERIPREYTKYGTVSMKTDLYQFGDFIYSLIKYCGTTERWKSLFDLLTRFVVEEDCFSDPLYTKLCHPFCDPSELKDIRRCFDINMIYQELPLDITILDVIEMLDSNMQVLPQKYNIFRVPSVLHGAPIPSTWERFTLLELKTATCDFSDDNLLRSVSTTLLYKGQLSDGRVVTIKDYPIIWGQKYLPDFQRMHQHENIVSILGYCVYTKVENMLDLEEANDHVLVVEEYLPNGMLLDIFEDKRPELDWRTAFGIIRGIAQCVAYIHAHHFIYIYLNGEDIFLDSDMNPKISGFGFSEELDHGNPNATQTVAKLNIVSDMPAEYLADGVVSTKTDVYRFGVLAYFIITHLSSSDHWERIVDLLMDGKTVDSSLFELCHHLCDSSDLEEIRKCIALCDDCVSPDSEDRPTMPDVVQMLDDIVTTKPEVIKTLSDSTGDDKDDGTDVFKALSLRDY